MTTETAPLRIQSITDITHVLVMGAGQMGRGIAQVFAQSGRHVTVFDVRQEGLELARSEIASSAERMHAKGKLTDEQLAATREQIAYSTDLSSIDVSRVGLAVEAATEHLETKLAIFRQLDELLPAGAMLASNTSSISITTIAAATQRPTMVAGMHFMNPVPVLELVEVISGLETSADVTELVMQLARDLGKTPVHSRDMPGFIANRILMPMINEAFFCLQENVGTAEGIDEVMRLGMRHPLGPLALADLIGLDTTLAILEVLHRDLGDDKYRPAPLLRQYVAAGRIGRKSGRGVYDYA